MNISSSVIKPKLAKAPAKAAEQAAPQENKPSNVEIFTDGFSGGAKRAVGVAGGVAGFVGLGTLGAGLASGGALIGNIGEIVSSIGSGDIMEVGSALLKTVTSAGMYAVGGGLVGGTIGGVLGYRLSAGAAGMAGDFGAAITPKSVGKHYGRAAATTALGVGLGIAGAQVFGHGLTGVVGLMGAAGGVYAVAKANG